MTIPTRCQGCYKYHRKTVDAACSLCQNIGFAEQVLCDLNRKAQQDADDFECAVFRPHLAVVRPQAASASPGDAPAPPTHDIMKSQKVKWALAYAKQQLAMRPGAASCPVKCHLCLPTFGRRPLFDLPNDDIDHLAEIVTESGGLFSGAAYFLSLGPDHLHLYFESTPDESVDEIAGHIMAHTESGLREMLGPEAPAQGRVFASYFVETIG